MTNITTLKRFASLTAFVAAIVFLSGHLTQVSAQRDPFSKPSFMKAKPPVTKSAKKVTVPVKPVDYSPPPVEARIEYYKRLREAAAANGTPLPKVTSVLTLSEMAVTGIFKTPRGYAAMVEATPIKLSYTIYPGEKFFDGQLVAVEENRLVFRKVTKVGEGKFVASVENKPLRPFSVKSMLEGTAAEQSPDKPVETASNTQPPATTAKDDKTDPKAVKPASNPFLSPLDEMNKTPDEPAPDKTKKAPKKTEKVAKNKKQ